MSRADALAREQAPVPELLEVPDGEGGFPALFGETSRYPCIPAVGDDERLQELQVHLREHANPLVAAAAPILDLILVLAEGAFHEAPRELRMQAASEIRAFHRRLEQHSVSLRSMRVASYALCGAIDEAVLTTDWGSDSDWSTNTLLWTFHQDSTGGESFFKYVADLAAGPDTQVELVELLVLLVDLGFQGRHRVSQDGAYALETIRQQLHAAVRAHRPEATSPVGTTGPVARTGSQSWRAVLTTFAVCVVLVLAACYTTLYMRTQSLAEPLEARLEALQDDNSSPDDSRVVTSN